MSLDLQAIEQSSKLEWMQQELHRAREEKEAMETSIKELTNQVKELTTRLESGAVALKGIGDICTFRAAEPLPPAEPRGTEFLRPSAVHEQRGPPISAPGPQVPNLIPSQPSTPDRSFHRYFFNTDVQTSSYPRIDPAPTTGGQEGISLSPTSPRGRVTMIRKLIMRQVDWLKAIIEDSANSYGHRETEISPNQDCSQGGESDYGA